MPGSLFETQYRMHEETGMGVLCADGMGMERIYGGWFSLPVTL